MEETDLQPGQSDMIRRISRFCDLRIGKKLLLINAVTMSLAALLILTLIVAILTYTERGKLLDQVRMQSLMNAENLGATLIFNDQSSANNLLVNLRNLPYINKAELFDAARKPFAIYSRNEHFASTSSELSQKINNQIPEVIDYGWLTLKYQHVVEVRDQEVGFLYLEASLDQLYSQMLYFMGLAIVAILFSAIAGLLMLNRLQKSITSPLMRLTGLMGDISKENDYSRRFQLDTQDEIGELAAGFNEMLKQIEKRDEKLDLELLEKRKSEVRLDRLAHYDMVTQLPNRYYFNHRLATETTGYRIYGFEFGLMFIDLDNFKIINDTLGHHVGDELLRQVAERLKTVVRSGDTVARLGGDEFGVILANLVRPEDASIVATKIIEKLADPLYLDGHAIVVGASIGISLFPNDADDIDELMKNADTAMYHAKDRGKNNFKFFTEALRGLAHHRMVMESQLRNALQCKELFLNYQPQFDVVTRHIVGVEALLRWQHGELGRISPVEFIPVAEESGLIVTIGEWVFRSACEQAKAWHEVGLNLTVAVNVSGRQFRDEKLVEHFNNILDETGVDPSMMEIELTESSLMDSSEATSKKLDALTALGLKLSIDDFGTGYSSMSYLKRFPISKLKIDRSFVTDIGFNKNDQAIARAIIALGSCMEMRIIAEGIENEEQLSKLIESGCHQGQGFLISPAVSPDEVMVICRKLNVINLAEV